MSKANLRAGTSPFAHLLANITGRSASRRAEEEREEDQTAEDEHDDAEDGADEPTDGKKGKKARGKRAEDEDDDEEDDGDDDADAEDEDEDASADDDDMDEPEKGKRGKRAEGDDDKEAKGRRAGVTAERQRWSKVLGHKHAGAGRIAAACNMLATTDMSASAVISTLGTLPSQEARGPGLRERMSGHKQPDVGASGGRTGAPSLATQIIAAGKKRRGEA